MITIISEDCKTPATQYPNLSLRHDATNGFTYLVTWSWDGELTYVFCNGKDAFREAVGYIFDRCPGAISNIMLWDEVDMPNVGAVHRPPSAPATNPEHHEDPNSGIDDAHLGF